MKAGPQAAPAGGADGRLRCPKSSCGPFSLFRLACMAERSTAAAGSRILLLVARAIRPRTVVTADRRPPLSRCHLAPGRQPYRLSPPPDLRTTQPQEGVGPGGVGPKVNESTVWHQNCLTCRTSVLHAHFPPIVEAIVACQHISASLLSIAPARTFRRNAVSAFRVVL